MKFEAIDTIFEKGSLLPVDDVWKERYVTPIKVSLILKNQLERITFFKIKNATYPDIEDEYLLYKEGLQIKVYIYWYLENKCWNIKWSCVTGETSNIKDEINELLYDVCMAIDFPSKIVPNSPYPIKIRELVRLKR